MNIFKKIVFTAKVLPRWKGLYKPYVMVNTANRTPFVFKGLVWPVQVIVMICVAWCGIGRADVATAYPVPNEVLTNILQVKNLASLQNELNCHVRIQGVVLWVSPARDELILQDESGGTVVKADWRNDAGIQPGQKIFIEGSCRANLEGISFGLLINNDGIHASSDKLGSLRLSAGLHPICVEWFNGPGNFDLAVDYQTPGTPRQPVPEGALFRADKEWDGGTNRLAQGLDYRCYEGEWERLPDFSRLPIVRAGVAANFDLKKRTCDTNVGLVFTGYFQVPQSGDYTIWLRSDDGGKLYIGNRPEILKMLGTAILPLPCPVIPGQLISRAQEYKWSEVEGMVTHVSEAYGGISVELTSDAGRAYLRVMDGNRDYLKLLLHSRITAVGIGRNARDIDGETSPSLMVPDLKDTAMVDLSSTHWADFPLVSIGSLIETNLPVEIGSLVHISGTVCSNLTDGRHVIDDKTGRILVETDRAILRTGEQIEAIGRCGQQAGDLVLRGAFYRRTLQDLDGNTAGMPLLTTALQVKSLSRMEAQRSYPVKIHGVIIANVGADYAIQDSTASIFVEWNGSVVGDLPKIGDFWEITGESYMDFAPNIKAEKAVYLGPGILPAPLRPTKDELINGSLDVQYVELQGIVISASVVNLTLLTREGQIKLLMHGIAPGSLEKLINARVRVRGVNSPERDKDKRMSAPLMLFNASVSVDELPPLRPFELPLKHAADLLLFDVRADVFRRVKVAGQVLHERNGVYFLRDGASGLRFETKDQVKPGVGDLVEVVGFADISGPSPVLHEGIMRTVGKAGLPPAQPLAEDTMLSGNLDATLVSLKSQLLGLSTDNADQILELKTGTQSYTARLAKARGMLAGILPGSELELTGTYAGYGGDRAAGRDIDSFELLLNAPTDIRVLARPSWWTFPHTMAVVGALMSVILAALVWISLLHRQVSERTLQLSSEIKGREQAEYQRALEEERARIASDLHDELGATLTEIRFLGATESRDLSVPEATRSRLMKVSQRSHQMVSSLDEIVWAINPANDFLPSLADYLCQVAEEFFRATEVRCRLDVDESLPLVPQTSEVRQNLYLVVREALNNIAKHSRATEAWLRIHWENGVLHVVIEDNGRGFNGAEASSGNGLLNMRRRLEKIGGRFEVGSQPKGGTVCRIWLPITQNN